MSGKGVALIFAIVAVACVARTDASCARFHRCSECLYDAAEGLLERYQNCTWCASTSRCIEATDQAAVGECRSTITPTSGGTCDDMQCSAARTTNNIYICRPNVMVAFVASILLIVVSILYFLWWRAIVQMPWRYSNIHSATKLVIANRGSVLASWAPAADQRASTTTDRRAWAPQDPNAIHPSEEYWAAVARWAFLPLFIGSTCGVVSFLLLLNVSLKPWFADWYYALLLLVPFTTYACFCGYVYRTRMPIPEDEHQTLSVFFQLAWVLRGRHLKSLFAVDEREGAVTSATTPGTATPAAAPAAGAAPAPAETAASATKAVGSAAVVMIDKEMKADTTKLLNYEESIEKNIRKKLLDTLTADEYIMWWEKPRRKDIIVDNRWLVHFFANTMLLGVWLWISSGIKEQDYGMTRMFASSSLAASGAIIFVFFLFLLSITLHGCNRFYVLTNKRLIYLADGLVGTTHLNATDINAVKCASIVSYQDMFFDPVRTFSWEVPEAARRLPPIKTNAFSCIRDIDGFLARFRQLAGSLDSDALDVNASHLRLVWRIHIAVNIVALQLMPILFIYNGLAPNDLSFVGMLVFFSYSLCFIQRGLRVQQLLVVPLNLVKEYSKWDAHRGSIAHTFLKRLFEGSHKGGSQQQQQQQRHD